MSLHKKMCGSKQWISSSTCQLSHIAEDIVEVAQTIPQRRIWNGSLNRSLMCPCSCVDVDVVSAETSTHPTMRRCVPNVLFHVISSQDDFLQDCVAPFFRMRRDLRRSTRALNRRRCQLMAPTAL